MRNYEEKTFQLSILLIFIFLSWGNIFADSFSTTNFSNNNNEDGWVIDYYGVISQDLDLNMSTMISDLYFTQLSEIPNFNVYDRRTVPANVRPSSSDINQTENDIFYTEIVKNQSEETWTLTYFILDKIEKQPVSRSKNYDSFYKILMESKNELETAVKELIAQSKELAVNNNNKNKSDYFSDDSFYNDSSNNSDLDSSINSSNNVANKDTADIQNSEKNRIHIKSPEMLSGTWKGDSSIDKIVILRGGRGFVIFKNGASMNISITIEENDGEQVIVVKQKGNSNASFYPELPRKIALLAAVSAPPIEWSMVLVNNMIMEGTKTTLIQDDESFKISEVPVTWQKIN